MVAIFAKYRWTATVLFFSGLGMLMYLKATTPESILSFVGQNLLMVLLFVFWIYLLGEMLRSKCRDKMFWIVFMFLTPFLTPVIYLFRRK